MWHLMSPVYAWPFIYTVPALLMSSLFLLVQVLYLSSLMPLMWLSKHLFRPHVYAHTCLSLLIIFSILSASEMLVKASELFFEFSLMPFICFPNAHSNHCLFAVYLILESHSNCSGHTFVYSFFMLVVVVVVVVVVA